MYVLDHELAYICGFPYGIMRIKKKIMHEVNCVHWKRISSTLTMCPIPAPLATNWHYGVDIDRVDNGWRHLASTSF